MGSFDAYNDSPFHIDTEGEQITLTFKPGIPSSSQGTVSWNIPPNANGCSAQADGQQSAYCGIIIVASESPVGPDEIPQDGKVYVGDPTLDPDLHAGDKIGNALVVGSFYEGEKKSKGEPLTTELIVNNLKPDTGYYIAAYAVDCQFRYHKKGVRAYSDKYGNQAEPDTPASQTIDFSQSLLPSDGTGLTPGVLYEFDVIWDKTFPNGTDFKTLEITVDGTSAGTYEDLLAEINKQLIEFDSPIKSPTAPNTGQFYWNADEKKLYQFNGESHDEIPVLVEPTDPSNVQIGTYWYNPDTQELKRWNVPSPSGWNDVSIIKYQTVDPTNLQCTDHWFDQTHGYVWNGSTWCELPTFIQDTDPAGSSTPVCGTYWYNNETQTLYQWDVDDERWVERSALYWPQDPTNLQNGTYWFDLTTNQLFQWDGITWNVQQAKIQEQPPISPQPNDLWFNPTTEELKYWDNITSDWVDLDVIVWDTDPTDVHSCGLWWDSVTDQLYTWDVVNQQWDLVPVFVQTSLDPTQPSPIEKDSLWFNPQTEELKKYDGSQWVDIDWIDHPTDPTQPQPGQSWYNSKDNLWKVWDVPNSGMWNDINPIDSTTDPTSIQTGTYWFDTTNDSLFVRNGIVWQPVLFSADPLFPSKGTIWFDTQTNNLVRWDGEKWIDYQPSVSATLQDTKIVFQTKETGSNNVLIIPALQSSTTSTCIMTGYADFGSGPRCDFEYRDEKKSYPVRLIDQSAYLWEHTNPKGNVLSPVPGEDGVPSTPSYDIIGVGDDGTPDERREMIDNIRQQLGYPVVEVELTNYQLNTAIDRAVELYRTRSGHAYTRGFFFLDIEPGQQHYKMTNKTIGYNRIVSISAAYRFTSAFLSTAHGAGAYGQIILQHLYNMGTYDLTSFHLISQYVEQLEHLFATRLTFHWDETKRLLSFYQKFVYPERVLLDCSVERTEQDILKDRFAKYWINRYALTEAMMILAQIRGKYATLPGAGGGVSLNAADLVTTAENYRVELMQQLDDYVADMPEEYGMHSAFIIG